MGTMLTKALQGKPHIVGLSIHRGGGKSSRGVQGLELPNRATLTQEGDECSRFYYREKEERKRGAM